MKRVVIFVFLVIFVQYASAEYKIYPTPQSITESGSEVTITQKVTLVIEEGVRANVQPFLEEVLNANGMTVPKRPVSSIKKIYVGVNGSGGEADLFATSCGLSRNVFTAGENKFDPYLLHITADGDIVILGDNNNSVFYGVSTLRQILNPTRNLKPVTIQDYAYTEYRGLVEGFYGKPFTVEQILSLLDFFKEYKLNTFIYGPKADPYHAGSWDQDYPTTLTDVERKKGFFTQSDFVTITNKAKECNVNFVWAIHPGLHGGMSFNSKSEMNPGIEKIMVKFDKMYNLGVRGFGVFVDDMTFTPSAEMTAYLPAQVQAKLKEKYNTSDATAEERVAPLFFVPTAYSIAHTLSSLSQLGSVDSDIVIAFTGDNVWSNINFSACQAIKNVIKRNPLFWWNNNCNDNHDDRLYMKHMTYRYTAQNAPIEPLGGVVFNTMQEGEASKVFLFGGADYCWNTASFNSQQNWEDCFSYLFPDKPELASAFKLFCLNSDATEEPSDLVQMYNSFKNSYSYGNIPAVTPQLIAKAKEIRDACNLLESMKDSEVIEEALMYEDIKQWIGKLSSMAYMISDALSWMQTPGELSEWTKYANVTKEYANLHKDSAFIAYTVEGTGTDASERYFEVHPSQQNMEPFVDYLMKQYSDYSPTLPERNRTPEIIDNISYLPSYVSLSTTSTAITLQGLSSLNLTTGDYVGINLNSKKEVTVSASSSTLPAEFYYEYSINGKEWFDFTPDGATPIELVYVRVRNVSHDVTMPVSVNSITINIPRSGVVTPVNAETNIPQYENNSVSNVIDYSNDNLFWSNRAQNLGDYIRVDLGSVKSIYKVEVIFDSNDHPTGECAIEFSNDASMWQGLGTFTAEDISSNKYEILGECMGRYVQLKLNSTSGDNWLKVKKIKVYEGKEVAVAKDNNGEYVAALDDRSLATAYAPKAEGWLEYEFTENLNFETIDIYHNTNFDENEELPVVSIKADGEWHELGYLSDPLTQFNVSRYSEVTLMKFEWNAVNMPNIYDIVANGTPYEASHDITGVEDNAISSQNIYADGEGLHISGVTGAVSVCNAAGVVVWQQEISEDVTIPLSGSGVYVVTTQNGSFKVIK